MDFSVVFQSWYTTIGVSSLFVFLVLRGYLVPRSYIDDLRNDRDKQVELANAEAARWRQAYEYSEAARRLDSEHTGQLLEFGRTTNRVIGALPPTREGEPDAAASAVEGQ